MIEGEDSLSFLVFQPWTLLHCKQPQAADALKITSKDLRKLGLIDQILPEPVGGAHSDPIKATETLKSALIENLEELSRLSSGERKELRYAKFRKMGIFTER